MTLKLKFIEEDFNEIYREVNTGKKYALCDGALYTANNMYNEPCYLVHEEFEIVE